MRTIISLLSLFLCTSLSAQTVSNLYICSGNTATQVALSKTGSIKYSADGTKINIAGTDYTVAEIDSITFAQPQFVSADAKIHIIYNGKAVGVAIPSSIKDVTYTIDGANVNITSSTTTTEYTYMVEGSSEDGSLVINGDYKLTVQLSGVNLKSSKGAPIDIECGKRVALELMKGTTSTLEDCKKGKQKATLYCKGHLEFDKTGTLNITGNTAHAISAKEYIQLKKTTGTINILGAAKDGIHCKQFFLSNGMTVNMSNVADDGIQAEKEGVANEEGYDDGSITIQGGTYKMNITADDATGMNAETTMTITDAKSSPVIDITSTGKADKGLKAGGNITITAGKLTFTQSGSALTTVDGTSYTTSIKSDANINITGGNVTISNTAEGGRGTYATGSVNISSGASVTDNTK